MCIRGRKGREGVCAHVEGRGGREGGCVRGKKGRERGCVCHALGKNITDIQMILVHSHTETDQTILKFRCMVTSTHHF